MGAEDRTTAAKMITNTANAGINNIAKLGVDAIACVSIQRENIMSEVRSAAADSSSAKTISIAGACVDISTGAGALVLDDALQELSTLEQAAAQLVAAENKAQKQVHSVTGQG
ncbi:hypothetical protein NO2_1197 [Candidatus Termititenax persephonae]|uniref:Uncharacterized protein n=1 Tax=Candidatus Termititenax persephonae TaxID=2218525 RepID=A0A388TID1_9BACT|nr:hypothetical protein NO2_1197 [Candidatus Termititenax persephonae]